jgi:hypothetical protein
VSLTYVPMELRRLVVERAGERCEYCLLPAGAAFFPHEVDHVIAEKHGGVAAAENLAFACWRCNRHKGSDLGSFDPHTHAFAFLFNPRIQAWSAHFALHGEYIVGLAPEGRTTVRLLRLNSEERLAERRRLRGRG